MSGNCRGWSSAVVMVVRRWWWWGGGTMSELCVAPNMVSWVTEVVWGRCGELYWHRWVYFYMRAACGARDSPPTPSLVNREEGGGLTTHTDFPSWVYAQTHQHAHIQHINEGVHSSCTNGVLSHALSLSVTYVLGKAILIPHFNTCSSNQQHGIVYYNRYNINSIFILCIEFTR